MTTAPYSLEFGYYPHPLAIATSGVAILTLPGLDKTVASVSAFEEIDGGWFYSPLQSTYFLGSGVRTRPYPARVFGLPKTHVISHVSPDSNDHLVFHIWALSFFTGMRLTTTEAGFVDATPLTPGRLVDFVIARRALDNTVALAETFWIKHRAEPKCSQLFAAAVHALYLSQYPQALQYEKFMLCYTALDACFALAKLLHSPPPRLSHARRAEWMCRLFGMGTPPWAEPQTAANGNVASIRNDAFHEAIFMDAPLGFAIHGSGTNKHLVLEMRNLICRLLVALLGGTSSDYVVSAVDTRQRMGLTLV